MRALRACNALCLIQVSYFRTRTHTGTKTFSSTLGNIGGDIRSGNALPSRLFVRPRGVKGGSRSLRHTVMINPLYLRPWSILNCGCIRVEDWDYAREAFARCVTTDDEDVESRNNLASVYLRMKYVLGTDLSQSEVRRVGAVRPALGSQLFVRPRTMTVTTSKSLSRMPTG